MKWLWINLAIIGVCYPMQVCCHCSTDYAGDVDYPYRYYQTKTLYDNVDRGDIRMHRRPSGCQPLAIVMLVRHGARYSGDDEADKFQLLENLKPRINSTGKAEMCALDLEKIKRWINWYDPSMEKDLAVPGIKEMTELGQRFSEAFPEIFSLSNKYRIISSDSGRTLQSAKVFLQHSYNASNAIEVDDRLLHSYDYCDRYLKEVDDNDTVTIEEEKFAEGEVIASIASKVAKRLGIPDAEITNDVVDTIRKEGCAEEEWALGNNSSWCRAFTKEDLQAFEYQEDLDDYVSKSFGYEISYESSCVVKSHILEALYNVSQGEHRSHYLFGHSQTLMSTLTSMKLIEDDGPFLSEDYPKQLNRKFRGSIYTPSAGNIAFVVYRCNGEMKLQVFRNENLMKLPLENPHPGQLWGLEEALQYYKTNTSECNWSERCSLNDAFTSSPKEKTSEDGFPSATFLRIGVVSVVLLWIVIMLRAAS